MKKILVINIGGTFNKIYNPATGSLDVDKRGQALEQIQKAWLNKFKIIDIIAKDSLELTKKDRALIVETVRSTKKKKIIIIHGTDTMDKTAKVLHQAKLKKNIILTGAMIPYSINPIEAIANFGSAYGYIQNCKKNGVYISMNGKINNHKRVIKNKEKGYFVETK